MSDFLELEEKLNNSAKRRVGRILNILESANIPVPQSTRQLIKSEIYYMKDDALSLLKDKAS